MKTMWNDKKHGAPAPIQARIEAALADRFTPHAARIENAIGIAYTAGYDFPKPSLPELDEFEALSKAKAPKLALYQRDHSVILDQQKRVRDLWQRLRPWADGEPAHVLAERVAEEREERERAAAVERRAVELMAQAERARFDTAHAKAVKAAREELGQ